MGKEKKQQTPDKQQKDSRLMFFSKSRKKHKKLFIVIIILLVLAIGGGVWFFWNNYINEKSSNSTSQDGTSQSLESSEKVTNASNEAQKIVNTGGSVETAAAVYDDALDITKDAYSKSIMLIYKAALYSDSGDIEEAIIIAKQAEELDSNITVTSFIANKYDINGDTEDAIYYYKKTINLLDKTQPSYSEDLQYYQNRINTISESS